MREYLTLPDAVPASTIATMRDWAATSLHVGASPLKGTFMASRGFSITFTPDGLEGIARKFPELWPYFELAVVGRPWTPLLSFTEHLALAFAGRRVRGFYFNLLSVPAGAAVGTHVDATLSDVASGEHVTPLIVSVLYLNTPGNGGRLRLRRGDKDVGEITPEPGMLVCFRGDLWHEVSTVDGQGERTSLVCEQYAFTKARVATMQPMVVTSRGMFGRVLERTREQT